MQVGDFVAIDLGNKSPGKGKIIGLTGTAALISEYILSGDRWIDSGRKSQHHLSCLTKIEDIERQSKQAKLKAILRQLKAKYKKA